MFFLIRTLSLLPLPILYGLADYLIYPILRYIVRYRLKLVQKNIRLSFPEKTPREQKQIIQDFCLKVHQLRHVGLKATMI